MKTILITGGNTGIGLATAADLCSRGHHVVIACRNELKAQQAIESIKAKQADASIEYRSLDLARLADIQRFSAEFLANHPSLDVLVNNAGLLQKEQQFTADGFEKQIGVNYLGAFLLTHLLLPALSKPDNARIVHLSSFMHRFGRIDSSRFRGWKKYSGVGAYCQSKLANALFSAELAKRLPSTITSNALHPGGVDSDIFRDLPNWQYQLIKPTLITTARAGAFIADMAEHKKWQDRSGELVSAHGPLPISKYTRDAELCRFLYEESCGLVGVEAL